MNSKSTQKLHFRKNEAASKMSDSNGEGLVKISAFGIGLTNETSENILEYIIKNLPKQQNSYYIVTPNPEMLVLANKDLEFRNILNNAKIALVDGMQLYRGARLLGIPLKERIIGTNFVENLCEKVANRPITVGFLGGGPKIAENAAECLKAKFPGLKVVFAEAEWDEGSGGPVKEFPPAGARSRNTDLRASGSPSFFATPSNINYQPSTINHQPHIDILFVAFGFPKQEKWMAEHVGKIPVKVMMGVGGALDQIVDPSLRPPESLHRVGLGWLYRLVREPWRVKRQAKLVEFVGMVIREKFKDRD